MSRQPERRGQPASPSDEEESAPAHNTRHRVGGARVLHSPPPAGRAPQASVTDVTHPPLPPLSGGRVQSSAGSVSTTSSRRRALVARAAAAKAQLERKQLQREAERVRRLAEKEAEIENNIAAAERDELEARLQEELAELSEEEEEKRPRSHTSEARIQQVEEWLAAGREREEPAVSKDPEHRTYEEDRAVAPLIPRGETTPGTEVTTIADLTKALIDAVKTTAGAANVTPQAAATDRLLSRLTTRDIAPFSGDPTDWLRFKAAYEASTHLAQYSAKENIIRLQSCLKGEARDAVAAQMLVAASPETVMKTLELRFGRPDLIVGRLVKELHAHPKLSTHQGELITLATKVANTVAAIEATGQRGYLFSPELINATTAKLSEPLLLRWRDYAYDKDPVEPRLPVMAAFLLGEADRACRTGTCEVAAQMKTASTVKLVHKPSVKQKRERYEPAVLAIREESCPHCKQRHQLPDCPAYEKLNVEERWDLARKSNLCFRCLSSRHRRTQCEKKVRCEICQRSHHTLLHKDTWMADQVNKSEVDGTVAHIHEKRGRVLLKVVPVRVEGPSGAVETCALLDEGATISLVDSELAAKIGAVGPTDVLTIQGATAPQKTSCSSKTVSLLLHTSEGPQLVESLRTVEDLKLPSQAVSKIDLDLPHLRAVPIKKYSGRPQILIGQDNWHLIVTRELREGNSNQPVASRTRLGWVLHGCRSGANRKMEFGLHLREEEDELHRLVEAQFALDNIGITPARRVSPEDQKAMATLQEACHAKDGRWEVGLLWRGNTVLPNNRLQAERRLQQLQRKMKRDPGYANEYSKKIEELLERGYAERVSATQEYSRRWFLPHFGVRNSNKPGKLRLVFDASAEYGGVTLNSALLTGPPLINSLLGVLLRFREGKYAVVADIQEMFLRIHVKEEDRRVQSFLWQTEEDAAPAVYQMKSLIFGATCSPTAAIYVLNKNAEESGCSPRALAAVKTRHYVDDYLDSFATREEAKEVVNEVDAVHQRGGFKLRGWRSNEEEILGNRVSVTEDVRLGQPAENAERTLGLLWRPREDTLSIAVDVKRMTEGKHERPSPTKREMLAVIMSCFDPLGLVAPTMIRAKILMQKVWRSGIGWDDRLTEETAEIWRSWLEEVTSLQELKVKRHFDVGDTAELHVFADASAEAYAAVAYLTGKSEDNKRSVAFVAAKCKVAPIKTTTIPRMELQAALVGARLGDTVIKELSGIKVVRRYYWTDSRTVYCWIRGAGNSEPFIAHRLAAIEELTLRNEWRWLPGEENVADAATRVEHDETASIRWLQGPDFLRRGEEAWPPALHEEESTTVMAIDEVVPGPGTTPLIDIERFSRWGRAVGALAYVLLFIERCRKTNRRMRPELLRNAEWLIIREEQRKTFSDEMDKLSREQDLHRGSKLAKLSPGLDEQRCLRVFGRTSPAGGVTRDQRQPFILDKGSRVARLVVEEAHKRMGHQQLETQINEVRQRFHIIGHRNLARKVVAECAVCKEIRGKAPQPRMSDLPATRLAHHERPFTNTGVDLFGPMKVTVGRRHEKRWVALFTCLTTRAVHLEVVHSLTQDATLMALRRMAARRGYPRVIWSDNGTNFIGSREELRRMTAAITSDPRVERQLAEKGTVWKTIPPAAPHMGGAWERLIRAVKAALSTTLKERAPRDELLNTVLAEAEATVNSRPLTHISIDPGDAEALTPNHFLLGGSNTTPRTAPGGGVQDMKRQWRLAQELADKFWERWVKEYLPELRRRERWPTDKGEEVAEGDVVVIADGNSPRNIWPRGRILRLHRGRDGRARVADVATRGGVLRRPVCKIVVIHHEAATS